MSGRESLAPFLRCCGSLNPAGNILECVIVDAERETVIGLSAKDCRELLTEVAMAIENHEDGPAGVVMHEATVGHASAARTVPLQISHAEIWAFHLATAIVLAGQRRRHLARLAAEGLT